jgi:hypothetical protein
MGAVRRFAWLCGLGLGVGGEALAEPLAVEHQRIQHYSPTIEGSEALHTAVDGAKVRAEAAETGSVVAELPLGSSLVRAAGSPVEGTVGGRSGHWVPVKTESGSGFVWSGALGPAPIRQDLSGDGKPDTITLGYFPDHRLILRVAPSEAGAGIVTLDLEVQQDMGGFLEQAQLGIVPASFAGLPLIQVHVPGSEQCGGYSRTTLVALGQEGGKPRLWAAPVQVEGGDAPVYTSTEVVGNAKQHTLTFTQINGEAMDDGSQQEELRTVIHRLGPTGWVAGPEKVSERRIKP